MSVEIPNGKYHIDYSESDCKCDPTDPPVIIVTDDGLYCECPECGEYIGDLERE